MTNRENVIAILFADPDYFGEAGFWFTSDDQAFTDNHKNLGLLHAKTLEDKELVWVGRNLIASAPAPSPSPVERGSLEAVVSTDVETSVSGDAPADVVVETPAEVVVDAPADVVVDAPAEGEAPADAPAEVVVEKKSE